MSNPAGGVTGAQLESAPRRVLICPDSFKGSLTAQEAAASIARGLRQVLPQLEIESLPLADGGEGTLEVLLQALGGQKKGLWVTGPLGDPVRAEYGVAGDLAMVELAQAAGLALVPPERRDPTRTTTCGLGELLRAACQEPVAEIWVALGGSATVDGGSGMAQALGYRLLDQAGDPIGWGGGELARLQHIRPPDHPCWQGKRLLGLCDVHNPLTGPTGAAFVFAPQKGATPRQVQELEQALQHWARLLERDLGQSVERIPGAGAAGGVGAALVACLGATLTLGFPLLAERLQLRERLERCDLVITGEGRLDEQSAMGKVVGGVLQQALAAQKPLWILCGQVTPAARAWLAAQPLPIAVGAIADWIPDLAEAQQQATRHLEELAARQLRQGLAPTAQPRLV